MELLKVRAYVMLYYSSHRIALFFYICLVVY